MSGASNITGKTKSFTCSICGKNFDSSETLQVHRDKDHSIASEPPTGVG